MIVAEFTEPRWFRARMREWALLWRFAVAAAKKCRDLALLLEGAERLLDSAFGGEAERPRRGTRPGKAGR